MFKLSLLAILCLVVQIWGEETPTPTPDHFPVDSINPISRAIKNRNGINDLIEHIEYIDQAVYTATEKAGENSAEEDNGPEPPTTCNHRDDGWNKAVMDYADKRGWQHPDMACVSDVYGANADDGVPIISDPNKKGISKKRAYEIVTNHAKHINEIAREAVKNSGLSDNPDWKIARNIEPQRESEFKHEVIAQDCKYDYAAFIRQNGQWYVAERITNAVSNLTRGKSKRQYLYEYVNRNRETLPVKFHDKDRNETIEYSTVRRSTSGFVSASGFNDIFPHKNVAVQTAIRENTHSTQQAQDATTVSNIAILALPLMMNVVPVALIAETNNLGMLVYTLLTDVLTAIPLAIKGVEVLTIGKQSKYAVVTRVTGGNINSQEKTGNDSDKAGEMWVAECKTSESFTVMGAVFLAAAILFMIVGIALEFAARSWQRRQKHRQRPSPHGPSQGGHGAYLVPPTSSAQFQSPGNTHSGPNTFSYSNQNVDEELGASTGFGLEHPAAVALAMTQGTRERNTSEEGRWWRRNRRKDQQRVPFTGFSAGTRQAGPSIDEQDDSKME